MKGFAELVAAAQVGTRKAPPARATEMPLEGTERTVLLELGTLGLMRRAGAGGTAATPLPQAPPETLKVALDAALVEEALDESLSTVLEWAERAARKGFVAPPATVSRLVALAPKHPQLVPILGARGRWLAESMGVELPEAAPEVHPSPEEFDAMDGREKAEALREWGEPSPHDDALLRKGLADRRREVREAALDLSLRLPDADPTKTMRELATTVVTIRKSILRTTMEIAPPDPATLPDWLPRTPARPGMGAQALALLDVVRRTPPSAWGHSVSDLLAGATKTDDEAALTEGWREAAIRFGETAWIDALFVRSVRSNVSDPALIQAASDAAFDAAMRERLGKDRHRWGDMALGPIALRNRILSPALSRALVEAAREGGSGYYGFRDLALRLDLSVLPLVSQGHWTADESVDRLRDHWRKILELRSRLRDTLR